jgi:hypothetical protein
MKGIGDHRYVVAALSRRSIPAFRSAPRDNDAAAVHGAAAALLLQ